MSGYKKAFKQLVDNLVDDMECLGKCDSHTHEQDCPVTNPVAAFRQLRKKITCLEKQLDSTPDFIKVGNGTLHGAIDHWQDKYESLNQNLPKIKADAIREMLSEVMGGIDLDPFSSAIANKNVKAGVFFNKENDVLNQEWLFDRVWMNYPFSREMNRLCIEKLINDFAAGWDAAMQTVLNHLKANSSDKPTGDDGSIFVVRNGKEIGPLCNTCANDFTCTQCDEIAVELHEGYCEDCCNQNQEELDRHNAEYDRWQRMDDEKRDEAILSGYT